MTGAEAKAMVLTVLEALMTGDAETVAQGVAEDCEIVFTGGRRFSRPADIAAFNAGRYAWVRKRLERADVAEGAAGPDGPDFVVYSMGALYGAWPDGAPFDDMRYIDRFELRGGRIVKWEVWNDAGERLLERAGG